MQVCGKDYEKKLPDSPACVAAYVAVYFQSVQLLTQIETVQSNPSQRG